MYGIFDLEIGLGDTIANKKACNHLTRYGLQHVLKGKPPRTQTVVVPTNLNKVFSNTLNYLFIVMGTKTGPSPIPDEDIYNLTIDNLPEDTIWIDYGSTKSTHNLPIGPGETLYVRGIGIGHKDIGGDPANDFIFSYANTLVEISNVYYTNDDRPRTYWTFSGGYSFYTKSPTLPALNLYLGETKYKFIETVRTGTLYGINSEFTSYLGYSNWTGPNVASLTSVKPGFYWNICGQPGAPSETFEEMIVEDPLTRELTRVFKATYYNKRPFDIDITGFGYRFGAEDFNYISEIGNYIRVPAGKRFELVFAVDVAGANISTTSNKYYDFSTKPLTYNYDSFGLANNSYGVIYNYVQYEGTSKEKKYSVNRNNGSLDPSNVFRDELTKAFVQYKDGTYSAPIYLLGTKTPASYAYAAPSIVATDGWVLQNNKLVFAITVPASISYVQFGLNDNNWNVYPVTPGTINYIDLPIKYFYEGYAYVRWGNTGASGLISYYSGRIVNTTEMVNVEPIMYRGTASFAVLGYPSRQSVPYAWRYCGNYNLTTYENLTRTAPGDVYGPIPSGSNFGTLYGAEILDTVKWFNPVTKTLDVVPAFAQRVTTTGVLEGQSTVYYFPEIGARRPTQSTNVKAVAFNGVPRISELTLVKLPTEAIPNSFKMVTLTGTRKVEVYDTSTNLVIKSIDTVPGTEYVVKLTNKLYNHIDYGIRYLDENGVNQSLGLEYMFKGVSLAAPDELRDIYYDTDSQTLTFVTPARATRATITRWGFELFSFETVINGETNLYTSEVLDPNGRYVLTLYNAEGLAGVPHYLFGDVEDPAVKPSTTGAYGFNDWIYNSSNYTNSGNALPFANPIWYEQGIYKITIDGQIARPAVVNRNTYNIITSIIFEANGAMLYWTTGYRESDQEYGKPASSVSGLSLLKSSNGYAVIDIWHEWMLYSEVGIDKIGVTNYGTWKASYGKNTSWYQFTEVNTGYVRNSLRVLMSTNSNDSSRVPFEYDTSITAKTPWAMIFPHTTDLVGSPYYDINRNYYTYLAFKPYINSVLGTLEPTFAADGKTVTKLRAITEEYVLVLDTADKTAGWLIENMDASKIGHPDYKDISITFELVNTSKYQWNTQVGTYPNSTGYDVSATSAVRVRSGYYIDQIFTRFYPYMSVLTYTEHTGLAIENAAFNSYTDASGDERNRWSEAYIAGDFNKIMQNASVVINGKLATVTTKEVTLPFIPQNNDLISSYQFERPLITNMGNNIKNPVVGEYTYTAFVFSIPGFTVSNEKHPKVLSIVENTLTNPLDSMRVYIVRNKILQPAFPVEYYGNTYNVRVNNALVVGAYYYNYITIALEPTYPAIIKNSSTIGTWETDDIFITKSPLNSLYAIANGIKDGLTAQNFTVPENNVLVGLVTINNESFDIVFNPNYFAYLVEPTPIFGEYAFKLTNVDNTKEIIFHSDALVEYVGFEAGVIFEILIGNFSGDADTSVINSILYWYESMGNSPMSEVGYPWLSSIYGYNKSMFWNYVPHLIPTGQQGLKLSFKTGTLAPTEYVENFIVPDRTSESISVFNTKLDSRFNIGLSNDLLSKLITPEGDLDVALVNSLLTFECNGVSSLPATSWVDTTEAGLDPYISVIFESLDIELRIYPMSHIELYDIAADDNLAREELFVFRFIAKGLSLTKNDSAFTFRNSNSDTPLYNIISSQMGFYNDVNGNERYESLYIVTGLKPIEYIPIDSRIGASPFPNYSRGSYVYASTNYSDQE